MPPTPPPSAEVKTGDAPLDLPDNALAIVLSHVGSTEELLRASTVSQQWRDVTDASPVWADCIIKPRDMNAKEADGLVKRGKGKVQTVEVDLFQYRAGEDRGNPGSKVPIDYRISTRGDWDEAFQSLVTNKSLESIAFTTTPSLDVLSFGEDRKASFHIGANRAVGALCDIAGELPLSLKTISLKALVAYGGQGIVTSTILRAFEAAPCCRDGKCKIDVEPCTLPNCGGVQAKESCMVCSDNVEVTCNECSDWHDVHDVSIQRCAAGMGHSPEDGCGRFRCNREACKEKMPDFQFCERCWGSICGLCDQRAGRGFGCDKCADWICGPCIGPHMLTCAECDARGIDTDHAHDTNAAGLLVCESCETSSCAACTAKRGACSDCNTAFCASNACRSSRGPSPSCGCARCGWCIDDYEPHDCK